MNSQLNSLIDTFDVLIEKLQTEKSTQPTTSTDCFTKNIPSFVLDYNDPNYSFQTWFEQNEHFFRDLPDEDSKKNVLLNLFGTNELAYLQQHLTPVSLLSFDELVTKCKNVLTAVNLKQSKSIENVKEHRPGRLKEFFQNLNTKPFWLYLGWKIFILALIYLNLWTFFGDQALPPNGDLFHMFMLFIAANICGQLSWVCNLPGLFGMLVAGFIYGNVFQIDLDKRLTSTTRSFALMVILLRAGLNLDPKAIKKLSFVCFRLSILPCIAETIMVAVCAYFLFNFDISWSLMLGFVLAALSSAVVVPDMIRMQETNLGVEKGIPTLIMASCSIDNVLAITGFSVSLSFAFSSFQNSGGTWQVVMSILQGPIEVAIGIGFGILVGVLFWFVPEVCNLQKTNYTKEYDLHRFVFLFLAGLFALFGSQFFGLSASGPLAVLVVAFIPSLRWRPHQLHLFSEEVLKVLWTIFEHFLFCLIGSDVRINQMQTSVLLYSFVCLIAGIIIRTVVSYLITYGNGFTHKERLFTAIAWTPKATVQAAFGPVALDQAVSAADIHNGRLILTAAVLSILITAPLGAIAIDFFKDILLTKSTKAQINCKTVDDYPNESDHEPLVSFRLSAKS